jgi:hypothetical protein
VSHQPRVDELLAPLTERDADGSARQWKVDREAVISRMVEVALAPEARTPSRARWAAALALAASVALVAWGGLHWLHGRAEEQAALPGVEVVSLRGKVDFSAEGTLETSAGAEVRIKSRGMEVDVRENTKMSLSELGAAAGSAAVRLDRGKVRCVIPHDPGRTFSVVTANARVIDVGTVFSVSVEPSAGEPTTVVHVEEGEVLVEHAGKQSRLTASQSWSSAPPPAPVSATPPVAPPEETRPEPSPPRRDSAPAKRQRQTLAAETDLLRSGLAKEQRGDLRGARGDYEALVSRYPDSPLALDAKAALARVKARLQSSK